MLSLDWGLKEHRVILSFTQKDEPILFFLAAIPIPNPLFYFNSIFDIIFCPVFYFVFSRMINPISVEIGFPQRCAHEDKSTKIYYNNKNIPIIP